MCSWLLRSLTGTTLTDFRITVSVVFARVSKMNKYFYTVVVLACMLTGCASVLPGKDNAKSQVTTNKVPPGYVQGSKGISLRLRSLRSFGLGGSSKPSGPQVYDPDYAEYLEWKRWQEFKAYQEWKAKKESQAQGS